MTDHDVDAKDQDQRFLASLQLGISTGCIRRLADEARAGIDGAPGALFLAGAPGALLLAVAARGTPHFDAALDLIDCHVADREAEFDFDDRRGRGAEFWRILDALEATEDAEAEAWQERCMDALEEQERR